MRRAGATLHRGGRASHCRGLFLLRGTGSRRAGSVVVAHGPSCSAACGIFPDQGSNPCPLHWQADSQPLHHQGSPDAMFYKLCQFFFLFFFKRIFLFIYLFLAVLGLRFVRGPSPVTASGGHSSSRCAGLSLSRPLPLRGTGSRRAGSVVVAHGPQIGRAHV